MSRTPSGGGDDFLQYASEPLPNSPVRANCKNCGAGVTTTHHAFKRQGGGMFDMRCDTCHGRKFEKASTGVPRVAIAPANNKPPSKTAAIKIARAQAATTAGSYAKQPPRKPGATP